MSYKYRPNKNYGFLDLYRVYKHWSSYIFDVIQVRYLMICRSYLFWCSNTLLYSFRALYFNVFFSVYVLFVENILMYVLFKFFSVLIKCYIFSALTNEEHSPFPPLIFLRTSPKIPLQDKELDIQSLWLSSVPLWPIFSRRGTVSWVGARTLDVGIYFCQ